MGLIKSNVVPADIAAFSLADIEKQGRAILLRARQRAEMVLIEAQAEAETLKKAAQAEGEAAGHQVGMQQGLEEGRKAGNQHALEEHREQLTQLVKALAEGATSIDSSRTQLQIEATHEVARLAIAIAGRISRRLGAIDEQVLMANLSEAMNLVVQAADVRIAVNPAQKEVLSRTLPRLQLQFPALAHVDLVEDGTLAPGGCRIFTRQGMIDADLDAQLERIASELVPPR